MIRNYIKIAWRNLLRHKGFSLINIIGLTTGLTCCLLLILYIQHELSYDKFHDKGNRIARLIMEYRIGDASNKGNFTSTKVFPEFKRQFPEVESGVRMTTTERLIKYEGNIWNEKDVLYVDSTFFKVFDFKLLKGSADEALKSPNNLVLSQSVARKYFGNENPVGKTLLLSSRQDPYLVTAVVEDCPSNSQIRYSMVASISSFGPLQEETYSNANFTTYLLINSEHSFQTLQQKISAFMAKESVGSGWEVDFELEPFMDIHLYSPYDAFTPNSNINYIYIIGGVAIMILIIACFTYVNLSTARSTERAKEVGIRKVSGAWRSQLFLQFISESGVLAIIALLISFLLAAFLLPYFNALTQTVLSVKSLFSTRMVLVALVATTFIALLAGSYLPWYFPVFIR
jgi:putative ABC transport system permease protein